MNAEANTVEDQNIDRRVRKTKKQLRQALMDLMSEKPSKSISVRELAERADINRGTFYIHYKDVGDLLQRLEDEMAERLILVCKKYAYANTEVNAFPYLTELYRYAQDILGRCSALLLDVAVDSALELTLGASTVPAQSLLPGYMACFTRENPACRCTLLCGDSAAVQQMLLNGDIHLGFVGSADDRQDLIYEPIAEDRLVLITPNTPRFAALKTQGVLGRELFREPFLFRERGSGTQKVIDNYLSEIRLDPQVIHTVAYVSDPTVLQRLVAEGTGVSILSALAVQEAVAAGQLLQFELDETPVRRSIYMARRRKSSMSSPARTFAELVRKQAKASV